MPAPAPGDGPSGGLARVIGGLSRTGPRWLPPSVRVHPDPVQRRRLLEDARGLFDLGLAEAFAVGCALGAATEGFATLLFGYLPGPSVSFAVVLAPTLASTLLVGSVAVAALGTGLWRRAHVDRSDRPWSVMLAGAGLGAGAIVGANVSFVPAQVIAHVPGDGLDAGDLVCDLLLFVGLALAEGCLGACALAWLGARAGAPFPRAGYVLSLVAGSIAVGTWLGVLFIVRAVASQLVPGGASAPYLAAAVLQTALLVLGNPLWLLAAAALWALPAAAEASRPRPDRAWRPRLAVLVGLAAGVLFWPLAAVGYAVGVLVLMAAGGMGLAPQSRPEFLLWLLAPAATCAIVLPVAAAIIVARLLPRLRTTHGVLAAVIASAVIAAGLLLGTRPGSLDSPIFFLVEVVVIVDLAGSLIGIAVWSLGARILGGR